MKVIDKYLLKLKGLETYKKEEISLDLQVSEGEHCKVRPYPGDPFYTEFCNFQGDRIREILKPIICEVKEENFFLDLTKAPENKWIKDLNFKIIFQFHVSPIKMKKQYKFASTQLLKRGEKGGTLDPRALNLLPDHAKELFKNSINQGNIFCYITDFVVSLPLEYLTYT